MADIIDINVFQSVNSISFEVEPITNIVNINKITTTGYSGVPSLQDVTDIGATTTNTITANSFIKSGGTGANVLLDNGNTAILPSIVGLATTTYVDNKDNSKQLQLNYLDRDNSIFDAFYLRTIADGGTFEASNQLLSSLAVLRNISYVNEGYTQQINADKFVKLGGAADEYLMADGSISFGGGGGGGATNLSTTQTSTNFTINSNTGTDATVPLGNGSLAGATLNDYTNAEKALVATIPNINTNAVDRDTVKLGEAINKGQAVYVSNATGTNIIVLKASNASEATSSKTFGLLETTGVLNDIVNVVTSGLLSTLNTSTATVGDAVWLGTAGNLIFGLANKPVAPAHLVYIGIVTRVSATVGEIFISIQNGFELREIHDILLTSVANNNGLFYDSATSLWKNKSIATVLGYTPANDSGVVHIAGTETMTGIKTIAPDTQDEDATGIIRTVLTVTNADINATEDIAGGLAINAFSNGTAIYASSPFGYAINAFSEGTAIHANSLEQTAILAESEGIGIVSNCSLGKPIVTYGNGAATPSIENNLGNTNKGLVVNSGASSTGNVIEHNKNSTINFSVNQLGEVTAAKFIKQSGTAAQLLAADGSVITEGTGITISGGTISSSGGSSAQGAYTILANNTASSAVPSEKGFRNEASKAYAGATPSWTGTTAPTGTTNHTYSWSRIGNIVYLRVSLDYTTAGSAVSQVTFDLPSDCPTPELPSGVSTALDVISYGSGMLAANRNVPAAPTATYSAIRIKSAGVYEINIGRTTAAAHRYAYATIQYFTT